MLVGAGARAGGREYTVYDIGNLGCHTNTEARDVNDHGAVVGLSTPVECVLPQAVLWHNGILTSLEGAYEGWFFRGAAGISENGVIAGSGDPEEALVYHEGTAIPLDTPEGCGENDPTLGINSKGTLIVGRCGTEVEHDPRPTLYFTDSLEAVNLGVLPDAPPNSEGFAEGVNDDGVVVGRITTIVGNFAFIWQDGLMREIVNTVGGAYGNAYAINNAGMIVGSAETQSGFPAMQYDMNTGVMEVLGPGTAFGINDRGSAVGRDIQDFTGKHAMLYEGGETIDLHEFMPAFWATSVACSINNYGWIVGDAEALNGNDFGWLLVPIYDKGDYDGDTDVDHQDFANFQRCFAAEPYIDGTLHVGCSVFDFDDDMDLDLDDYAAFQSAFTGPTAPNLNPNGPA